MSNLATRAVHIEFIEAQVPSSMNQDGRELFRFCTSPDPSAEVDIEVGSIQIVFWFDHRGHQMPFDVLPILWTAVLDLFEELGIK